MNFRVRKTLSILLFASILCWMPVSLIAQQAFSATDLISRAKAEIDLKNLRSAERDLKQALKVRTDSAEAYYLLAKIYYLQGSLDQSLSAVDKAFVYQPDYPDARYLYVQITIDAGRAIDSHLRVAPNGQSQTMYDIGKLMSLRKQLAQAIADGAKFSEAYNLAGDLEISYSAYRHQTDTPVSRGEDRSEPVNLLYIKALQDFEEAVRLARPGQEGIKQLKTKVDFLREIIKNDYQDNRSYISPRVLARPHPSYTDAARKHKVQGIVVLGVKVNEHGGTSSGFVVSGLGYGLDKEALNVINRMTMSPALINGKPTAVTILVTVTFTLSSQNFADRG